MLAGWMTAAHCASHGAWIGTMFTLQSLLAFKLQDKELWEDSPPALKNLPHARPPYATLQNLDFDLQFHRYMQRSLIELHKHSSMVAPQCHQRR